MPSWIGPWEIAIVVVIALLIFGPRKLPDLGSSLGKSIRGFRQGMKDGQDEIKKTVAEVKEATSTAEAPLAKSQAAGVETSVETPAATAAAQAEAPQATATLEQPKCWGTWEEGHEACLQCTVAAQCAETGRQTPLGG